MYIKLLIGHNIITTEYFHSHIIMFMLFRQLETQMLENALHIKNYY